MEMFLTYRMGIMSSENEGYRATGASDTTAVAKTDHVKVKKNFV